MAAVTSARPIPGGDDRRRTTIPKTARSLRIRRVSSPTIAPSDSATKTMSSPAGHAGGQVTFARGSVEGRLDADPAVFGGHVADEIDDARDVGGLGNADRWGHERLLRAKVADGFARYLEYECAASWGLYRRRASARFRRRGRPSRTGRAVRTRRLRIWPAGPIRRLRRRHPSRANRRRAPPAGGDALGNIAAAYFIFGAGARSDPD